MDLDRIERLLAKYWECDTTLEEEKELRQFFTTAEVPEHLIAYKHLFSYYEEEHKGGELDSLFDKEVIAEITQQSEKKSQKGKVIPLFYNISRVAAVILVVVVAGYFIREEYIDKKENVEPLITDTFEDPKAAFEETKRALKMISANFNKGREEAKKIGAFHEAQEKAKDIETEL